MNIPNASLPGAAETAPRFTLFELFIVTAFAAVHLAIARYGPELALSLSLVSVPVSVAFWLQRKNEFGIVGGAITAAMICIFWCMLLGLLHSVYLNLCLPAVPKNTLGLGNPLNFALSCAKFGIVICVVPAVIYSFVHAVVLVQRNS